MKTPKEKAEQLFNKYHQLTKTLDENNNWYGIFAMKKLAKQCALIAVDEIYNEIDDNYDTLHSSDRKQYWQEVKKEIELL